MTALPALTEHDVRRRVGDAAFKRAQGYFRKRAILDLRRQGRTLRAACQGSFPEPYDVRVTFDARGIAKADCSCPIGDGGYCKHVAALLLTWLDRPDAIVVQPSFTEALEAYTRDDLVALVLRFVERHPDLEDLLALPPDATEPLDRAAVARLVRRAFEGDLYEWGSLRRVARDLDRVVALAVPYAEAGAWPSVVLVAEVLLGAIMKRYDQLHDEDGDLGTVVVDSVDLLVRCLAETPPEDPAPEIAESRVEATRLLVDVLLWDTRLGGLGMGDQGKAALVTHTSPAERAAARTPIEAALSRLGPPPKAANRRTHFTADGWERDALGGLLLALGAPLDDEAYLALCRTSGRTPDSVERLFDLGRTDEALAAARDATDYVLLSLLPLLLGHGLAEQADALALDRIDTPKPDRRLLEWVKDRARTRNDAVLAQRLAERLFWAAPSVAQYAEALDLARALQREDAVRAALRVRLRDERQHDLLVRILLHDGDPDAALALLHLPDEEWGRMPGIAGPIRHRLRLEVARLLRDERPAEAEELYLDAALTLIEQRGRNNYAEAAQLLKEVRALSRAPGGTGDWPRILAELRETGHTLPAFLDELNKAGL